jgi:hypothetical protein
MSMFSRNLAVALMGAAILSSCSRPVAYFQRTQPERFAAKTEAVAAPVATNEATVAPAVEVAPVAAPVPVAVEKAEKVAQAKEVMNQVDAYVRNDSKLASNKTLTKRIAHAKQMLASAETNTALNTTAASTKKMSLMEKMVMKKLDKKIKNHVAPEEANALNRNLRNGIIIGAIGLILSLFGGVISIIGLILLVVGVVLILLGVLE